MPYTDERNIAHTLVSITAMGTAQAGAMGASFSKSVPRAAYATGANRNVMATGVMDAMQHRVTTSFFDANAIVDHATARASVSITFSGAAGSGSPSTGAHSIGAMVACDYRHTYGRLGEPVQQDFVSEGVPAESITI